MKSKALLTLFILVTQLLQGDEQVFSFSLGKMNAGELATFSTKGKPNAGKTDFSFKHPDSWKPQNSFRSGVVSRISCCEGDGPDAIVVWVKQMRDQEIIIPEKDWQVFVNDFQIPDAEMITRTRVRNENFDGARFAYILNQKRGPIEIIAHVTNYLFFQNGAMVQLQFYVTLGQDEEENKIRISGFEPLWEEILSTLKQN